MAWSESLRRGAVGLVTEGINLLFPPRCVLCGHEDFLKVAEERLAGSRPLCLNCVRQITADVERCLICGTAGPMSGRCRRCRGRCADWEGIAVLGGYGDRLREGVLRSKHPAGYDVLVGLTALLLERHRPTFNSWQIDLIVPVPMHWMRRMVRGTSTADVMAQTIGRLTAVEVRHALRRRRATAMQNRLPHADRRANVRDAFRSQGLVTGRRVLLVDDVATTGGTLGACARELRRAGAATVHAAVLARADHDNGGNARGD